MENTDEGRLWAWVDVETTGLEPSTGNLLEVAVVLTDSQLREIHADTWIVAFNGLVSDHIRRMHGPEGSRLLSEVKVPRSSLLSPSSEQTLFYTEGGIPRGAVDEQLSAILKGLCDGAPPFFCARNPDFDRAWLRAHLPRSEALFHYRTIDETTLRVAMGAWAGITIPRTSEFGVTEHRAMPDVLQTLSVARHIRHAMRAFRSP